MNVLLICSVPDPKLHQAWIATADVTAIREAVRGLAAAAKSIGRTLVVADHPAIVALTSAILPPAQLVIIDRKAIPVYRNASFAILIGGCDNELEQARCAMRAEVGVYPIASTGSAALALWDELARERVFDADESNRLRHDRVYGPLFERLLSS